MLRNRPVNPMFTFLWITLWVSISVAFVFFLPGFSEFDTSKYLTISQQMMHEHQYILAYWEGHPYSDKPPLLFWLFIGGWRLFGFSHWWPQLVVMITALFSIFATQKLARALWPNDRLIPKLVPFILLGCFYWVWFAKQIRVDSLLVLATVLSILCIIKTLQGKPAYWLGYILALGLGGFAKGPVILAFVLFPAILLPAMTTNTYKFSPKWFALLGFTTILGMCLPLAWAIPAAIKGGHAFTQEIFYRQITHRQHMNQTSFFFYITRLPLWLLPWSLYPVVYKQLGTLKILRPLSADTACLFILICGIIVFSIFGQKLPHYIYPLFPFFALLIARLCAKPTPYRKGYQWPMAVLTLLLASFCLFYPHLKQHLSEQTFIRGYFLQAVNLSSWGVAFLAASLALFFLNVKTTWNQVILIALVNVMIALFVNTGVLSHYLPRINNAEMINTLEQHKNQVVAFGTFTDSGVLAFLKKHQIKTLTAKELQRWQQHPQGNLLLSTDASMLHQQHKPLAWFYQSRFSVVGLWET